MYDSHQDLLEALCATPDVFKKLLNGLTQERATSLRGGDENWSIVEVMCHLRDAEERALERMQWMRDQHEPTLAGYDQEVWARERTMLPPIYAMPLIRFCAFAPRTLPISRCCRPTRGSESASTPNKGALR